MDDFDLNKDTYLSLHDYTYIFQRHVMNYDFYPG